jgi:hypothetical protein
MLDLVNIIYPAFVQASRSRQVRGTAGDAGFGKYYLPGFCTSFLVVIRLTGTGMYM